MTNEKWAKIQAEQAKIEAEKKKKLLDAYSTAFILKQLRCIHYDYDWMPEDGEPSILINGFYYNRDELKAYLATRPHVMNKKEGKADRIARKKAGISRKK